MGKQWQHPDQEGLAGLGTEHHHDEAPDCGGTTSNQIPERFIGVAAEEGFGELVGGTIGRVETNDQKGNADDADDEAGNTTDGQWGLLLFLFAFARVPKAGLV